MNVEHFSGSHVSAPDDIAELTCYLLSDAAGVTRRNVVRKSRTP